MTDYRIYYDDDYCALYGDGKLLREGEEYHINEYLHNLLGVTNIYDTDFYDEQTCKAFDSVEEIESANEGGIDTLIALGGKPSGFDDVLLSTPSVKVVRINDLPSMLPDFTKRHPECESIVVHFAGDSMTPNTLPLLYALGSFPHAYFNAPAPTNPQLLESATRLARAINPEVQINVPLSRFADTPTRPFA